MVATNQAKPTPSSSIRIWPDEPAGPRHTTVAATASWPSRQTVAVTGNVLANDGLRGRGGAGASCP